MNPLALQHQKEIAPSKGENRSVLGYGARHGTLETEKDLADDRHKKIVMAKRTAMESAFFAACPLDDDHGFDRLMSMSNLSELENQDWGSVFLHHHLTDSPIERIQRYVHQRAVDLLRYLLGVQSNDAIEALSNSPTTATVNADGTYTEC